MASSIESAGAGLTEVEDSTASVRISFGSRRTLADISSILVDTLCSGATWVAQTLVQVDALQRHFRISSPSNSIWKVNCLFMAEQRVAEGSIISENKADKLPKRLGKIPAHIADLRFFQNNFTSNKRECIFSHLNNRRKEESLQIRDHRQASKGCKKGD